MHAPPAVSHPAGRSAVAAGLALALWLLGAGVIAAWTMLTREPGLPHAAATGAVVASGAFALVAWSRSPVGVLGWDGSGWMWHGPHGAQPGRPELALDLQQLLLLRWRPEAGGTRWLWLARGSAPLHWEALRRAVYSPATIAAPEGVLAPMDES